MKHLKSNFNRITLLAVALLMANPIFAQTGKTLVNKFLTDWLLPIFVFFLIAGTLRGIITNYELIADKNEEGTRLKGFKNVGVLLLYITIAFAILAGVIAAANAAMSNIQIN